MIQSETTANNGPAQRGADLVGRTLSHYRITAAIGAGGMGEVYRATDTKLGRDVALKVLPEAFAQDAERMARFRREAQVLASLNHPNIATIHGLEDSGSVHALAMELVEGATLADRIKPGSVPLDKALTLSRQIAEALEYAHERGIVHRDLKPANIKITPEGTVKVLDFGLAKALNPRDSGSNLNQTNSPTLSIAATQVGVIQGTAAYMSPEQAKGKSVDRRADIWAFGCVLYEMLTGQQAFDGETVSDILAAVIMKDPDWSRLAPATPAAIQKLVRRCLQKDPKQRLQAIGEARITLDETLNSNPETALGPPIPALEAVAGRQRHALPWALVGIASVALLASLYAYWRTTRSAPPAPIELSLTIPPGQQLETHDGPAVVLSPDGLRVACAARAPSGKDQIYLRRLDQSEPSPLEGALGDSPFFSPDGQWIGFFGGDGKLEKISVFGGTPVALANLTGNRGAWWGEDGTIVFPTAVVGPLDRIPASGGDPIAVTHLDAGRKEVTHRWPQILPGGKDVLFTASADNNQFEHAYIEAASLATGQAQVLVENAYFGRYLPSGFLTYVSGSSLFAVPFDAKALKVTGTALPILSNIQADLSNGGAQFSFSQTGTAAYMTGESVSAQMTIVLMDRKGSVSPMVEQPGDYVSPRFSPDGKQLALQVGIGNVWVYNLARETMTQLTFAPGSCIVPIWTPDGKRIACSRIDTGGVRMGISWLPADGTGGMEPLTAAGTVTGIPTSWSPDGRTLAFFQSPTETRREIWTLPVDSSGKPGQAQPYLAQGGGIFTDPELSPDGHWMAYVSAETGRAEVYVVPFPGPGGKRQISVAGGRFPRWSKAGHELFFIDDGQPADLIAVPYSVEGNSFQPGKPETLFQSEFNARMPYPAYDVAPDGKHFAVLQVAGGNQTASAAPTIVLNWFVRVARLAAAGQK